MKVIPGETLLAGTCKYSKGKRPVDDAEKAGIVQAGSSGAFAVLIEKHQKYLLNFIYRLVGDEQNAADIAREVPLNVYKSIRVFDIRRGASYSAWLLITARNLCLTELRKNASCIPQKPGKRGERPRFSSQLTNRGVSGTLRSQECSFRKRHAGSPGHGSISGK
jgi:hypothetical protein